MGRGGFSGLTILIVMVVSSAHRSMRFSLRVLIQYIILCSFDILAARKAMID